MKLRHLFLAAIVPGFVLVACGGKEESDEPSTPASSAEGKEDACEDFCAQVSQCEGFDATGCEEDCTEGDTTSRGGQEVLTECFTTDVCEATETAGLEAIACVTEGLEDVELSDEAETYCNESVDKINACLGSEAPAATFGSCEDTIALASDELLAELNECADEPCDQVETCVSLQAFQSIPLDVLADLEAGEELSPAALAELLAVGVVFGQLGLDAGGGLEGIIPGTGMGGAAN